MRDAIKDVLSKYIGKIPRELDVTSWDALLNLACNDIESLICCKKSDNKDDNKNVYHCVIGKNGNVIVYDDNKNVFFSRSKLSDSFDKDKIIDSIVDNIIKLDVRCGIENNK